MAAERASAREAVKLLKYKQFGMWREGGAKEKEREKRNSGRRGGGLGGEENQLYLESGYSCKHSGVYEGLGQARPKHGAVSRLSCREVNWETGG